MYLWSDAFPWNVCFKIYRQIIQFVIQNKKGVCVCCFFYFSFTPVSRPSLKSSQWGRTKNAIFNVNKIVWQFQTRSTGGRCNPKELSFFFFFSNGGVTICIWPDGRRWAPSPSRRRMLRTNMIILRLRAPWRAKPAEARAQRLLLTLPASRALALAISSKRQVLMIEASLRSVAGCFCFGFFFSPPPSDGVWAHVEVRRTQVFFYVFMFELVSFFCRHSILTR